MAKIYFDSEFEGLFPAARLISIGLTDDRGQHTFYAEADGNYDIACCSQFCKDIVLPLLEGGDRAMPMAGLRDKLFRWLEARGAGTVLVCDSPRDVVQLDALFPAGLPRNCTCTVVGFWAKWYRRIKNFRSRIQRLHALRPHHALDDAVANRIIFEGS